MMMKRVPCQTRMGDIRHFLLVESEFKGSNDSLLSIYTHTQRRLPTPFELRVPMSVYISVLNFASKLSESLDPHFLLIGCPQTLPTSGETVYSVFRWRYIETIMVTPCTKSIQQTFSDLNWVDGMMDHQHDHSAAEGQVNLPRILNIVSSSFKFYLIIDDFNLKIHW